LEGGKEKGNGIGEGRTGQGMGNERRGEGKGRGEKTAGTREKGMSLGGNGNWGYRERGGRGGKGNEMDGNGNTEQGKEQKGGGREGHARTDMLCSVPNFSVIGNNIICTLMNMGTFTP